jgi:hypothetical protein
VDLTLATRDADASTIITVGGEIDVYTAPKLRDLITELVGQGRYHLVVDEGTDNMKNIAQAVQEGANAYLTRQFRTLASSPCRLLRPPGCCQRTTWASDRSFHLLPGGRRFSRCHRLLGHVARRARQPARAAAARQY